MTNDVPGAKDQAPVLIVDDEPDMCWALGHILRGHGIRSVAASTGHQALRLAETFRFRLAFIDAKLPDAEGIELARSIQGVEPGIRIVLVSGYFYHDDPEVLRASDAGIIAGFVGKPFLHEEILAVARSALAGASDAD
jgi:DNA-binding NtrC family response regulator